MADKKPQPKVEKVEREYTIPLREKCRVVPRYKKTPKAIKTIKEFLVRHMKIRDRDLNKIKLDKYLNETIWFRGIKRPPHKIKVKAIKEGNIVKVKLVDLSKTLKFKKAREDKILKAATEAVKKKKSVAAAKPAANVMTGAAPKGEQTEEEKKEEKKKAAAGAEATEQIEKAAAKTAKKAKEPSMKQPKRPQRKSLAK